jgi:peptidoglycan hydrolase-like protein with peptidoglycan-binding domain
MATAQATSLDRIARRRQRRVPRWRRRGSLLLYAGLAVVLLVAAGLVHELWPRARLTGDGSALARVRTASAGERLASVRVLDRAGRIVPVALRDGAIWPTRRVPAGAPLVIEATVRRAGWVGWLLGGTTRVRRTITTPSAAPVSRWLSVQPGGAVSVAFDAPVAAVGLGATSHRRRRPLTAPAARVATGIRATGGRRAGSVLIAAAPRPWELLPAPTRVSWFPAGQRPQLVVRPAPGTTLGPRSVLTLTFSQPFAAVFGANRPRLAGRTGGSWRVLDDHRLAFVPAGAGFAPGSRVEVLLPRALDVVGPVRTRTARSLAWTLPQPSTLRLQQVLAGLRYLPLTWTPAGRDVAATVVAQEEAAIAPPRGHFARRFAWPPSLAGLWRPGAWTVMTQGAVMAFEADHGLRPDGIAGRRVWAALYADAVAGRRNEHGYSYVDVRRSVPQTLELWHDGAVVLTTPVNTGVPAAPTTLGTHPVFLRFSSQTMSGTNPDGSHYSDPGIRWISYFHGGEGIHGFNRGSYGTPQSVGCVELPIATAARVWPYTTIGTLVTISS